MPLAEEVRNDRWYVTGVTQSGADGYVGRRRFHVAARTNLQRIGDHVIGFDDDFTEPLIIRSYFTSANVDGTWPGDHAYYGYVQFMQVRCGGTIIPPQVFGGRLTERAPYADSQDGYWFVDFMGPKDARAYGMDRPLYPFNARLSMEGLSKPDDFTVHPLPNGSLYSRTAPGETVSTCASLVAGAGPGLLTGPIIAQALARRSRLTKLTVRAADVQGRQPYRIALDFLKSQPLAEQSRPPLAGLDESGISARAIGDYVLLTLPDDEDLGATLAVRGERLTDGSLEVTAHLLSFYDMQEMEGHLGREAMLRIQEYVDGNGIRRVFPAPDVLGNGRGMSGLRHDSYTFTPDANVVTLRYNTVLYGITFRARTNSGSNHVISGFEWAAHYRYNEDTGALTLAAVRVPEAIEPVAKLKQMHGFVRYRDSAENLAKTIPSSEFAVPAAARDRFPGGGTVLFVDNTGTPVS
ncbi:hypothetical protein [Nonomuraea sp. NPDC003201]